MTGLLVWTDCYLLAMDGLSLTFELDVKGRKLVVAEPPSCVWALGEGAE